MCLIVGEDVGEIVKKKKTDRGKGQERWVGLPGVF